MKIYVLYNGKSQLLYDTYTWIEWTLCNIEVDKVLYKFEVSAIGETTERAKVELGLEKLNQGSPAGCRLVVSDLFTGP